MFSRAPKLRPALALVSDVLATLAAFAFAIGLRLWGQDPFRYALDEYGRLSLLIVPIWVACLEALGTYERERKLGWPGLALRVFEALVLANALLGVYAFYTRALFLSRLAMIFFFPANYVAIIAGRAALALVLREPVKRVLVVGTGKEAARAARERGREVVGYLGGAREAAVPAGRILGETSDLAGALGEHAPVDEGLSVSRKP